MRINFVQYVIDIIRHKKVLTHNKIVGKNNINIPKNLKKKIKLNIVGENNTIVIPENNNILGVVNINIYGNNNQVVLGENIHLTSAMDLLIGQKHPHFGFTNNTTFHIGKNTSIEGLKYTTFNSNVYCEIGDDCMLSFGVLLYNTDGHPILKKGTNEILNKVKGINIGKHSWLGLNSVILKNSIVPEHSIIGMNAVFSGKVGSQSYCVFAGNPACVVKENVDWDANGAKFGYIENEI